MEREKWAPAPWRVTHSRDDGESKFCRWQGAEVVDADGYLIARLGELIDGSGRQREPLRTLDVAAATADLVRAAPELLEAVERLMRIPNVLVIRDAYERGQPERADIDFALDVLAKVQP